MAAERRLFGPSSAEALELAFEDELTGLPNRRYLSRVLRDEWSEVAERSAPLSAIMLDLDGFKQVNDHHGHAAGDQVLQSAADLLRHNFRSADLLIRYGGDEFTVLVPRLAAAEAEALALQVRAQFDRHRFRVGGGELIDEALSFSFGVASYPADARSGPQLLAIADDRLYRDKRGRQAQRGGRPSREGEARPPIASVAVLPLRNLSGDPAQDYFAEGMTEELIVALARLGHLRVLSRSSVMRYQSARPAIPVIASDLGVDAVIEGSVLRVGGRVRVSVQLVDGLRDEHLWAESIDGDFADILELQREVARRAAAQLPATATAAAPAPSFEPSAVSVPVYEAYLKGRFHWNRLTLESIERARDCFSEALKIDPRHGPSLAATADCYIALQFLGGAAAELAPRARSSALQAVQYAPTLAAAHGALATVRFFFDWNWDAADAAFRQALALDPRASGAHQGQAYLFSALGRHDEAIAAIRRARDLDPLGLSVNVDLGWRYYFARQYPQAVRQLRLTLELDPAFGNAHWCLGCVLLELGEADSAISHLRRAAELSPGSAQPLSSLGFALARSGQRAEALRILEMLVEFNGTRPVSPWVSAVISAGLGDLEASIAALRAAQACGTPAMVWLKVHPELDPVRGQPDFEALIGEMQLR